MSKTVAFDLDGTLCEHIRNNHPEDILKVKPITRFITLLRNLKVEGYTILIFTRRGILPRGKELTIQWLNENKIPFDEIIVEKPHYDLLFDDRACEIFKSVLNVKTVEMYLRRSREHIEKSRIKG